MVIQTSSVAMGSRHQLSRTNLQAVGYGSWGGAVNSVSSTAATTPLATDGKQQAETKEGNLGKNGSTTWYTGMQGGAGRISSTVQDDDIFRAGGTEYDGLHQLLMIFSGQQTVKAHRMSYQDVIEKAQEETRRLLKELGLDLGDFSETGQGMQIQGGHRILTTHYYYEEKENTSFYTSGTVKTGDGRTIEFDIEAEMSRRFSEHTTVQIDYGAVQLMDPLVINLDGGTAEVSDQKFYFDIDCDGKQDNISLLQQGCGFLALDRNGDGKINDGSELFGAKSGNGFADLAVFDMDGNGWIDEKDEIFNHLRIWTKDDAGNDKLVALGVAGVGAIYLGHVASKFSLNSKEDNSTNAVVRESGLFLHENGKAGIIQQVDLAVG
ncbi:MAG: hypothetical protein K2N63_01470 [Lachnospiraceae bacterium]|nr:hypothetical protein [Lachnospiraceae bacterium]